MKIVYFTDTYYVDHGGRTHAREFYKALLDNDKVSEAFLFPEFSRIAEFSTNYKLKNVNGVFIFFVSYLKSLFPLWLKLFWRLNFPSKKLYSNLVNFIAVKNPDLLIVRHSDHFNYYHWLNRDFPDLKFIIEFNASLFSEGYRNVFFVNYWRRKEARSLINSYYVSSVSGYLKDYLISIVSELETKIMINPNGVDIDRFKPIDVDTIKKKRKEFNIPDDSIIFGYMGGMEKFRRLPVVVETFANLIEKGYSKLFLMVIGKGEDLYFVKEIIKAKESKLGNFFYCNGEWIDNTHVPMYINLFDVAIFPFTAPYCSPLKIYEYSACGLPILGPDIPALADGFGGELCEFLVKQDGSNFEESIISLYNDFETAKINSLKWRNITKERYTWSANVDRVLNVYSM